MISSASMKYHRLFEFCYPMLFYNQHVQLTCISWKCTEWGLYSFWIRRFNPTRFHFSGRGDSWNFIHHLHYFAPWVTCYLIRLSKDGRKFDWWFRFSHTLERRPTDGRRHEATPTNMKWKRKTTIRNTKQEQIPLLSTDCAILLPRMGIHWYS